MGFIETLEALDTDLFIFLNGMHNSFWDTIMVWISEKKTWIPFYAVLLFPLWKLLGKKMGYILLGAGLVILLCDQISVQCFKNVVERYRPCHNLDLQSIVHIVNNKCGGKFGFVSSHAANSFGLAVYLSLIFRVKWKGMVYLMLIWATVVSYSRIYLGVHYPADIMGGAILGSVLAYFVYRILLFFNNKKSLGIFTTTE